MWRCNLCSHKTSRRGNVIRHIREVHGIDDPNAQNATKVSNTGVRSNGKDKTTEVSHGLQSRMSDSGIPLSEHMTDLQDERRSLGQQPRMQKYDDSEEEEEENSEDEKRYQERYRNLPDQELTEERIDEIYGDLKAKKRRILDSVLKTIPDHLQTRAKRFCDALKCKDRLFILPNGCLNIDGKTLCGSHIRRLVMQEVEEPPTPGSIQYKLLEDENKTLRYLLKKQVKALARANGLSRIRKFESIIDGTIDYFDYSDDTNSDDCEDEEDEEDGDGTEYDDTDGSEDDEEEDEDAPS